MSQSMCLSGGVWDVRTTWRGTLVSWRGRALLFALDCVMFPAQRKYNKRMIVVQMMPFLGLLLTS